MNEGEGREPLPGFAPGRDPLDGVPERRVRAARLGAELVRWGAALGGPLAVLGWVSPLARDLPAVVRPGVALVVYLGVAVLVSVVLGWATRRVAVARVVRTSGEGIEIGGERLYGRERFEWRAGEAASGSGMLVPWGRLQKLFAVGLGGGDGAVGLWFHDPGGRALETWFRFEAGESRRFLEAASKASGVAVVERTPVPRGPGPGSPDATPGAEAP